MLHAPTLSAPALTDHAFATPHGRLMRALAPFPSRARAVLLSEAPTAGNPLVAFNPEDEVRGAADNGHVTRLPVGTRFLVNHADADSGLVNVLAIAPGLMRRLWVSAEVLQRCFQSDGTTLLEAVIERLGQYAALR